MMILGGNDEFPEKIDRLNYLPDYLIVCVFKRASKKLISTCLDNPGCTVSLKVNEKHAGTMLLNMMRQSFIH